MRLYYLLKCSSGIYLNENSSTLDTVAQVNALPGNFGNIQGDPKINIGNWMLAWDSPCREAGVNIGVTNDILGEIRPRSPKSYGQGRRI